MERVMEFTCVAALRARDRLRLRLQIRFDRQSPKKKNQSTLQPIPHQGPANDQPSLRNQNLPASLKPCPLIVHGPGLYLDRSEGPVLLPVWTRLSVVEKRVHESRDPLAQAVLEFSDGPTGSSDGPDRCLDPWKNSRKTEKCEKWKNLMLDDVSIVPVEKQTTFHFYRNQYIWIPK